MARLHASAVVLLVLAFGAAPAAAQRPVLAGETTMTGQDSGWTPVTLPAPMRVFPDDQGGGGPVAKLRVFGRGRVRGALLRAEQANLPEDRRAELWAIGDDGSTGVSGNAEILPAGDYRLHLFLDQGPATVELRAPSLQGTATLTPAVTEPIAMGPLAPRPGLQPQTMVFGEARELRAGGKLLLDVRYGTGATDVTRSEFCLYHEGEPDSDAYEPGCPGGASFEDPFFNYTAGSAERSFRLSADVPPGHPGAGGNFTFAGAPPALDAFAAWLPADPAGLAPPTPMPGSGSPPPQSQPEPPLKRSEPILPAVAAAGRLTVRRGRLSIPLRCGARRDCALLAQLLPAGRKRKVRMAAGARATLRLAVGRVLARRLARRGTATATLRLQGSDEYGALRMLDRRLRLRTAPR